MSSDMRRLMIIGALILGLASTAQAQSFDGMIQAEILPGWREDNGRHHAALKLTLAPGWHTYWRAPGDAGIPPRFDWSASRNLEGVAIQWPVPDVIWQNGMRSLGYYGSVVIPLQLTARNDQSDITLAANLSLGVCEVICVPAHLSLTATLPAPGANDPRIRTAWADRPLTAKEAGARSAVCRVTPQDDGLQVSMQVRLPPLGRGEVAAMETADPSIWVSEPKVARDGAVLTATADLVAPNGKPFALDRSGMRLTVFGDKSAVDIKGCTGG